MSVYLARVSLIIYNLRHYLNNTFYEPLVSKIRTCKI